MRHPTRALPPFALMAMTACAAARAPTPSMLAQAAGGEMPASSVRFHFLDHLSFGARVERVSLLLDGVPAYDGDGLALRSDTHVRVRPGPHTLAVVLRASEPCGLFEEPRTTVAVEATTSLRAGDGPATVVIDVSGTEATSDPLRTLAVRFSGDLVALGEPREEAPPPGCDGADALCAIDALAARARSRKDAAEASCYDRKRAEVRALQDVVDDSYATVKREGTTTGAAENAQLRARYADERIRAVAVAAAACGSHDGGERTRVVVTRKVERSCPTIDVTAGLDRF